MSNKKIKDIALISIFAAIIAICSQIIIPSPVPFTLQTFSIFLVLIVLGGKKGLLSILIYISLGVLGLPVFSGFSGGIGTLFNLTGGYILGFIFSGIIYFLLTEFFKNSLKIQIISMLSGLLICYIFGTVWYYFLFLKTENPVSLFSAVTSCVLPFLIPDILKIVFAFKIGQKIKKHLKSDF